METKSISKEEKNWGMLCHLASFSGWLVPFFHIIGPLIVWLAKRDEFPFVDSQGKESLNFQISVTIYWIIVCLLLFVLIGFLLAPCLFVFEFVMVIVASVKASGGVNYRYPLTIRFIK